MNPYKIINEFEEKVAEYAGCKYCVAVDSCTNAIFLCCKYIGVEVVIIPKFTYPSIPCAIINAGGNVQFSDHEWSEFYRLEPYPVYDAAHMFQRDMYKTSPYTLCGGDADLYPHAFMCISFSTTKPINIGKGGMILTNDDKAIEWFRQARYFGRHETPLMKDEFKMIGWNMYMMPEQAARGLLLMLNVEDKNHTPKTKYPDLSQFGIYSQP
jgi:dTDP-4-amino-4,6-dideoxygalactose transaminase